MRSHLTYLKILDEVDYDYDWEEPGALYDEETYIYFLNAQDFIMDYVKDSLDSYTDIGTIGQIMTRKDEAKTLDVSKYYDAEDKMAMKLAAALFEVPVEDLDFMKAHVLSLSKWIEERYWEYDITFDTPVFEYKTKDRLFYTVFSPTFQETYSLSVSRKENGYSYSLEPR